MGLQINLGKSSEYRCRIIIIIINLILMYFAIHIHSVRHNNKLPSNKAPSIFFARLFSPPWIPVRSSYFDSDQPDVDGE